MIFACTHGKLTSEHRRTARIDWGLVRPTLCAAVAS